MYTLAYYCAICLYDQFRICIRLTECEIYETKWNERNLYNQQIPCSTGVPIWASSLTLVTGVATTNSGDWSSTSKTFTSIAAVPVFTCYCTVKWQSGAVVYYKNIRQCEQFYLPWSWYLGEYYLMSYWCLCKCAGYLSQNSNWLQAERSGDRIPIGRGGGGVRFSATVQTGPWAHPASYTMGTGSFPGGRKQPGRDADPSPPSSAEV
jgi:hypothetical protein